MTDDSGDPDGRRTRPGARILSLAQELASEIRSDAYAVGSRFPTEQDLLTRFSVGRHTLREALKILTEQGILGRRRRIGTVVLSKQPVAPYVHSLRDIRGLLDFAQNTRLDIRHTGTGSVPPGLLAAFPEAAGTHWHRFAGLRFPGRETTPLCWAEILVPERLAPSEADIRAGKRAIYQLVMEGAGLKLEYVEQTVAAVRLSGPMAECLEAKKGDAALLVSRRYVGHTGETFELSQNLYPADRYTIRSVMRQRA